MDKSNKKRCLLCTSILKNYERKNLYCSFCQEVIDEFKTIKPICFNCGERIYGWNINYYRYHGRLCTHCITKVNKQIKSEHYGDYSRPL